ncbi:FAD-binding oxidoreductase [Nocardioides sp. CGMCC 1.13656]|nr:MULTISPECIES: FAD-binding oxidoreductase [unclassified Nocardioides]MBA2954389.1 FAD-binding oxidoreductase [Nocardioides sp. CGMCC 1.13656]
MTIELDTDIDPRTLIRPGRPGFDDLRGTFNVLDDQQPEAIAVPTDADEVADVVRWAHRRGLRVAAQSTGHNASPLGSLRGTVLLNTSRLTDVRIDAAARSVRAGAGTRWRDVSPQLADLGLAALHGSSPEVGIAGYSLGGGIGWLSRKHGLQTNAITAIDVVTAGGELVRADREHEPDLFWALRGGGGSFGVVTGFEFGVQPLAQVYAGALFYPVERIADVLHAWTALLPGFPEEMTTWCSTIHFPPFPEVPEPVRGRSFTIVLVAFLGAEADGRALLEPLRRLGPAMDTVAVQPPSALHRQAMDPESPLPFRATTALLEELTPSAIDDVARIAGAGSPLGLVEFRHLGGALHRATPDAGARATLPGEIGMLSLGVVPVPEAEPAVREALGGVAAATADQRVGDYPNFVMQPTDASRFFDAPTWARLRQVKAAYDPGDLVRGNHHVPPAR